MVVAGTLCPVLAGLLQTEDGDTRFLCLKLLCDILTVYLAEPSVYQQLEFSSPVGGATAAIDRLLREGVLSNHKHTMLHVHVQAPDAHVWLCTMHLGRAIPAL